ncbi:MAG: cache domain-containing protein [Lachnospiraceae bacterium]|nr:cache domain-containing protein [Lachnospiraceae bacterium]
MKLKMRLMLMTLIPMLLVIIIIAGIIVGEFPMLTRHNTEMGLKSTAYSLAGALNMIEGDYKVLKGHIYKGELDLSDGVEILESVKRDSNVDSIVFYGPTGYATTIKDNEGNRLKDLAAAGDIVDEVISFKGSYFESKVEYGGTEYYGFYVPLKQSGSDVINSMLFVGIPISEAKSRMFVIVWITLGTVVIFVVLAIIYSYRTSSSITSAVVSCNRAADKLTSGDLDIVIDNATLQRQDELGMLGKSNMKLASTLKDIVSEAKHCTDELGEASANLKKVSMDSNVAIKSIKNSVSSINQATSLQAKDTGMASEQVDVMSNAINDTAHEVKRLDKNSEVMKEKSERALEILDELKAINEEVDTAIKVIFEQTNKTNSSAKSIEEAVNLISDIANQTNLLSLNASIEAARAGEAGQGFAVVASEISALSEQTNNSAHTIQSIIVSLMKDSNNAVETMDNVREIIVRQNENVDRTVSIFNELEDNINITVETSEKISDDVNALEEARNAVEEALKNLSDVADKNALGTEETSASMDRVGNVVNKVSAAALSLSEMSERLDLTMSAFNIE